MLLEQKHVHVISERETINVQEEAKEETERNALHLMKRKNLADTKSEVSGSVVDENTPENTNNPIGCELCLHVAHHWRICWQF